MLHWLIVELHEQSIQRGSNCYCTSVSRLLRQGCHEIQKNQKEKIIVGTNEFKGHKYIDLRVHYEDETSGEYKPTKKGQSGQLRSTSPLIKEYEAKYGKIPEGRFKPFKLN